jgi:integrase/recombinase XerD
MNPYQQRKFDSLYQQHLNALRRQGKSPSTIDVYARAVRRIAEHFDRSPHALSFDELSQYFDWLIGQRSWSTVKVDRNGLQFFYYHVLGKQWHWLDLVKPPQKRVLPDLLSRDEVLRLINAARELRFQAFILAAFSMGLRIGEALNLTVSDIDAEHHHVHIRQAKGNKDRFVPMPDFTLRALRRLWASHRNPQWLFPSGQSQDARLTATLPMHRGSLQKAFRQIARDAGIQKAVSPHSLRHAYGACLVEAGLNLRAIQDAMGHASPVTTARYTQLTEPVQHNTLAQINALVDDFVIQWGTA